MAGCQPTMQSDPATGGDESLLGCPWGWKRYKIRLELRKAVVVRHPPSFFSLRASPSVGDSRKAKNKIYAKGLEGCRQPQDRKCKKKARTVPKELAQAPHNEFDKDRNFSRKVTTANLPN